jgi:pimeloyl-ACP methyl ester carboxylesterase
MQWKRRKTGGSQSSSVQAGSARRMARGAVAGAVLLAFLWGVGVRYPAIGDVIGDVLESDVAFVQIDSDRIEVHVYRPRDCASADRLIVVFHGADRNGEKYRKYVKDLADAECFLVYAPEFEKDDFPNWRYHRGGTVRNGKIQPRDDWTVDYARAIVDWARDREGEPNLPAVLFGHSAGAQYLSRVAAFGDTRGIEAIVLANASTYVLPDESEQAPNGFGGIMSREAAEEALRAYLAAPVTVLLGLEDNKQGKYLAVSEAAMRQGNNRLERGRFLFDSAERVADERGWRFGWQLVLVEDVGHDARGMLNAPEALDVLNFEGQ